MRAGAEGCGVVVWFGKYTDIASLVLPFGFTTPAYTRQAQSRLIASGGFHKCCCSLNYVSHNSKCKSDGVHRLVSKNWVRGCKNSPVGVDGRTPQKNADDRTNDGIGSQKGKGEFKVVKAEQTQIEIDICNA